MANTGKAKIKLLYVLKILQEETDAARGLTMPQIIERLAAYGISAERKSIYDDIKALREFDIDVKTYRRKPVEYAIVRHDFTLDELMLMIDVIQSCRALTEKQAQMLVMNVRQLASNREQGMLDKRIHVEGRIRSARESVFPTVDRIHDAVRKRCKLRFGYRRIGTDGKSYDAWKGAMRSVTPLGVAYDDGFYYFTAWDEAKERISEYRIDRMVRVRVLESEPATRNAELARWRSDSGKAALFGRFGGEEVTAVLAAKPDRAEILVDRFGSDARFVKTDADEARVEVRLCKSEQFFGWVAGLGKVVRIVSPASLVNDYRAYLQFLLDE